MTPEEASYRLHWTLNMWRYSKDTWPRNYHEETIILQVTTTSFLHIASFRNIDNAAKGLTAIQYH